MPRGRRSNGGDEDDDERTTSRKKDDRTVEIVARAGSRVLDREEISFDEYRSGEHKPKQAALNRAINDHMNELAREEAMRARGRDAD